jgi:hypothetical protein
MYFAVFSVAFSHLFFGPLGNTLLVETCGRTLEHHCVGWNNSGCVCLVTDGPVMAKNLPSAEV